MTYIPPIVKKEYEQYRCDGCGERKITNGLGKPQNWHQVLQKAPQGPLHFCVVCKDNQSTRSSDGRAAP